MSAGESESTADRSGDGPGNAPVERSMEVKGVRSGWGQKIKIGTTGTSKLGNQNDPRPGLGFDPSGKYTAAGPPPPTRRSPFLIASTSLPFTAASTVRRRGDFGVTCG